MNFCALYEEEFSGSFDEGEKAFDGDVAVRRVVGVHDFVRAECVALNDVAVGEDTEGATVDELLGLFDGFAPAVP